MKKITAILALSLAMCAAHAQAVDTSKLTPEQIATLNAKAQEMAGPVGVSATVRKEAEAWGELGANMGKAMVGAAKEVGVAANEFSQTPLGKIVVFMTAYKIIGQELLGVVVGAFILVFGYSMSIWLLTTHRWSTVTYEYHPVLWGLLTRRRILSVSTNKDVAISKLTAGAIMILITTMISIAIIL